MGADAAMAMFRERPPVSAHPGGRAVDGPEAPTGPEVPNGPSTARTGRLFSLREGRSRRGRAVAVAQCAGREDPAMNEPVRIGIAEAVGTMILIVGGPGTAILATGHFTGAMSSVGILGVALAFGLSLLVAAYAIGSVSGCHIN